MSKKQQVALFLARIALGWLFFYAGITKVLDSSWSAKGYLTHASTFSSFYNWLASDSMIGITNFVNEWGLTLLGVSLILGVFVRYFAWIGAAIMFLYFLPIMKFPHVGEHSYIVDEHVIYIFLLIIFWATNAGKIWGLDSLINKRSQ